VVILALPLPFSLERPFGLLVAGAALSGLMMWPYTALLAVINTTRLPEQTQPGWPRLVTLWWATAFFGYFSALLVGNWLATLVDPALFAIEMGVVGSAPGGYAIFAIVAIVELTIVQVSARAKRATTGTVEDADTSQGFLH
jgi:TRAP-type C4-dicarboxylate transport system permease large subunit